MHVAQVVPQQRDGQRVAIDLAYRRLKLPEVGFPADEVLEQVGAVVFVQVLQVQPVDSALPRGPSWSTWKRPRSVSGTRVVIRHSPSQSGFASSSSRARMESSVSWPPTGSRQRILQRSRPSSTSRNLFRLINGQPEATGPQVEAGRRIVSQPLSAVLTNRSAETRFSLVPWL